MKETNTQDSYPDTRLESIEDIRKAIAGSRRIATAKETGPEDDTHAFRAVYRPPMAIVCILDDGSADEGDWVRLRADKTVIGRSEGEIVIAHDAMMSSKHASITRHAHKGGFRWLLTDLGSTNGTFVRVSDTPIKHGQELLLGSRRFRFNSAPQGATAIEEEGPDAGAPKQTRGWQAVSPRDLIPSLIEVTPQGDGKQFMLKSNDVWIGRDPRHCTVVISDDLMLSPRHCRLHRDSKGAWHLENSGSRNGTWVRVTKIPLNTNAQFQLGEQRFFIKVIS
jgi:pSer/pThr/pTyr-binding forkhead associated (FHA) protein